MTDKIKLKTAYTLTWVDEQDKRHTDVIVANNDREVALELKKRHPEVYMIIGMETQPTPIPIDNLEKQIKKQRSKYI